MTEPYYAELGNGVRILAQQLPEETHYGLECRVLAGEKHVDDRQGGLPHFLEHLIFSGTTTRTVTDIDAMRSKIRGNFGASTSDEMTTYFGHALKEEGGENLSQLSCLIADILGNSIVPEERIEHEREVIINELYERRDDFYCLIGEQVRKNIFRDHPYARSLGGTPEAVSAFRREDFLALLRQYHTGNRMTIGIVGPDPAEEMAGPVIEDFLQIRGGPAIDPIPPARFHEGDMREKTTGFLAQNHFRICVPFDLTASHKHYYGGDFITEMVRSRLTSLRNTFSKSYGMVAKFTVYSDISFLTLQGCTQPATSDHYLKAAAEVIRDIRAGFSQKEFEDVLIPKAREMETIHRYSYPYMQEMMNDLAYRGRIFDPSERLAEYRQITYDYANEFLKRSIGEQVNITHMGPSTDFMSLDLFKELAFGPAQAAGFAKAAVPALTKG